MNPTGQLIGLLDYGGGYFGDVNVAEGNGNNWMKEFKKLTKTYLVAEE